MRVNDEKLREILIALTDGLKTPEFLDELYAVAPGIVKDLMDARSAGRVKKATQKAAESIEAAIPYEDIIGYLNAKTGKRYGLTEPYKRLIRARWDEGNRLEDFILVIDNKCRDWLPKPKMVPYLRPITLFSLSKFDIYKNEGGGNVGPEGRDGPNRPGGNRGKYSGLSNTYEIPGLFGGSGDDSSDPNS